jgi:hypothetical protein
VSPSGSDDDTTQEERSEALRLLEVLEDRSYKTYYSRLRASQRLASRHRAWNASLISTTTASAIASIALLADADIYGGAGPTLLVCISVLTLTASLVTSGLDYSGRSRDMFLNYRRIQRLSAEVERMKKEPHLHRFAVVEELNRRYDALLDESENHTEADYYRAFPIDKKSWSTRRESALSIFPYVSLLIPIGLVAPLVSWMTSSVSP